MNMPLYFVTGNKAKFAEIQAILPNIKLLDVDLPEIQSIHPQEVIAEKLAVATKHTTGDFIVEDVSLVITGMSGLPGPLIRWFLKTIGNDGLVKLAQIFGDAAVAKATIGFLHGSETHYFEGSVEGTIVAPRGSNGFGWDPIFQPTGQTQTFAEMSATEKSRFNMRVTAALKLKEFFA